MKLRRTKNMPFLGHLVEVSYMEDVCDGAKVTLHFLAFFIFFS